MAKNLLLLLLLVCSFTVNGQNAYYDWVKAIGKAGQSQGAESIALDDEGNLYTTGFFVGIVDFGPTTLNGGAGNVFVTKQKPNGDFVWALKVGPGKGYGQGIAVDKSGNVYVTGFFEKTVDFDPGTGVTELTSKYRDDAFVLKLDPNGKFLWVVHLGGDDAEDEGHHIGFDASGNVLIGGMFQDTIDFDPGPGVYNLGTVSKYSRDGFILKLNPDGGFIWAKQLTGSGSVKKVSSFASDDENNIYLTGRHHKTTDFDLGPGVVNGLVPGSLSKAFVLKLDSNGTYQWVTEIGDLSLNCASTGMGLDAKLNIYLAGWFSGNGDIDPSENTLNVTSAGKYDMFVMKLDPDGSFIWAKTMGGSKDDKILDVAVDADGGVYTTGHLVETVDMDPNAGVAEFIGYGVENAFVHKLDANGEFQWMKHFVGLNLQTRCFGQAVALDPSGNIYSAGKMFDGVDFDPGPGRVGWGGSGGSNLYIHKLRSCGNNIPEFTDFKASACETYQFQGRGYFVSGKYEIALPNRFGCDSILRLDLTINKATTKDTAIASCRAIVWERTTYNSSGTYKKTLASSKGCDSVVTIDLDITPIDVSTSVSSATVTANASGATYPMVELQEEL